MENEILWFGLLFFNLIMVVLSYRLFGKIGLFVWTAVAVILANIQVMKTIEVFGLVTALGNVVYSSLFLVTDILNENHSRDDAQKAVWIGFFVLISMTVLMQITLQFIPHQSDMLHSHIVAIFQYMPRIAFASLIAYLISQTHDVWFYSRLKKRLGSRFLWLRNNVSTITSQLIDNSVFTLLAFAGVEGFTWSVIAQIFFTSLVLKGLVSVFDTPFMYWARSIKEKTVKD